MLSIDTALARFLRDPSDEHSRTLAATGEAGARRVFDLYFTTDAEPFDDPVSDLGPTRSIAGPRPWP